MTKIVQEMTRLWEVNNSPALYFHFQFAHAWLPVNTRSWRGPCKHNHLGKVLMLTLALVQVYWLSSANVVTTESLHLLMQGQMQTCLMCKKIRDGPFVLLINNIHHWILTIIFTHVPWSPWLYVWRYSDDMVTSPVIIISVKGVHVHVLSVHKDILPRRMGNN